MSLPPRTLSKIGFTQIPSFDDGSSAEDAPVQRTPFFAHPRVLRWIIVALSVTIFALIYVIAVQDARYSNAAAIFQSQDIIPRGNLVQREFTEAFNYSDPDSHTAHVHELWPSYVSSSVRIAVKDPRTYELSPGFPSADGDESVELYVPAYVHQSHCIRMLRDSYWKHQGSGPIRTPAQIAQEHVHVEHCYDYLRQAILCLGDTTLEGPAHREDGKTSNTDGMGIKHQCRDMDFVRAQFRALGGSGSDRGK